MKSVYEECSLLEVVSKTPDVWTIKALCDMYFELTGITAFGIVNLQRKGPERLCIINYMQERILALTKPRYKMVCSSDLPDMQVDLGWFTMHLSGPSRWILKARW